jgi:phytoene synthase
MKASWVTSLAYRQCERITRKNSASFYKAFSQLKDKHQRQAVFAVYAFCRHVDDVIDEQHNLKALMKTKNHLDDFIQGHAPMHYRWIALKDTALRFYHEDYDYKPFYQMIEGQEFDANPIRISTIDQLLIYCDLVASSVGHMLLPILAPNQQNTEYFATALGRAFQITNILRDIGEDYRNNRIYLPSSLLEKYKYSEALLAKQTINSEFIALVDELASLAESYYQQAYKMLSLFKDDVRFSLEASLRIYRAILSVIKTSGYQVMNKKQFVSDQEKKAILKALMRQEPLV